ncbi:MATE family efflux transporter [Flavobacterium ustbae]|uniref:lipopolysaccharide biosynthesis protein n=1 Tax=Flavobacterium ustbae TaxID=2488790 RepID=UPI000F78AE7E|nr:lipopolysaccharide biosynthesis protein [Flavobacterium ustbae]
MENLNNNNNNNKRIAKNTLLLYFRMMLTMFVSLYTVRVILNTLGVVDYGIYNVVGGIVVMFSFLSNSMATASQRFFSFDLGRNDIPQLTITFSMTIIIYIIIALIILFLGETVGLWFLNSQMVIPPDRIIAANWIYQFSILSFLVTIFTVPFNALIIAHEDMGTYAYVSIVEVIFKLLVVYLLFLFSIDKLKLYAFLVFATTCITSAIYFFICKKKYKNIKFKLLWDQSLFKTLTSYFSWNLFGAVAGVLNNQGINILLNIFFGPIVNTARGIAYQVSSSVNQFVMGFTTAVNPQIIKYYSKGEIKEMLSLVFQSSKYSFFLIFTLSMPVLFETNFVLKLWLKIVPDNVVVFTRLVIICALIDSFSYSLQTLAQATGRIRLYQSLVGGVMLLNLPISFVLLKMGFLAESTMFVSIFISIVCLFLRLYLLKGMVDFPVNTFFNDVIKVILLITIISIISPLLIVLNMNESFLRFITIGLVSLTSVLINIYLLGLTKLEKKIVISFFKNKILNYQK